MSSHSISIMIFKIEFYIFFCIEGFMNIKKTLGEKIKRVRKQRGYTQEQLAERIDIAPRNLSKIEVGACFVTAETLEKLLVALNVTTEELFANDHIKDLLYLCCFNIHPFIV